VLPVSTQPYSEVPVRYAVYPELDEEPINLAFDPDLGV
jgi:hypothetical protein